MVIDAFNIWEGVTFSVSPKAREKNSRKSTSDFMVGSLWDARHSFKLICINHQELITAQKKNFKTAACMPKRLSNITVLIILYNAVLTFAPLIIIIIPANDKKILHSRIDLHFHCLNMV